MESTGRVVKVNNGIATVMVVRDSACGENCASCGACSSRQIELDALCDIDVTPGNMVVLNSSSGYVFLGLSAVFIIPIILPLITYIALVNWSMTFAVTACVLMLVVSLLFVFAISRSRLYLDRAKPRVISVINNK